jgi:hypothetical protein
MSIEIYAATVGRCVCTQRRYRYAARVSEHEIYSQMATPSAQMKHKLYAMVKLTNGGRRMEAGEGWR